MSEIHEAIKEVAADFNIANQRLAMATTLVSTNIAVSTAMQGVGDQALIVQHETIRQMSRMTKNYAAAVLSLAERFGKELREISEGINDG